MRRILTLALAGLLLTAAVAAGQLRYPPLDGRQIRIEMHLVPAISSGPLDPAWSSDGRWIAFSMRGDIWRVPAAGGVAVALTEGPAYHFQPAWSPDGRSIAMAVDDDGNLEIGLVPAEGGEVRRLTDHPHIDIEPAWAPDGRSLYFVSGRGGNLDILRLDLEDGAVQPVAAGDADEIHPAVSPDGRYLSYVSPPAGRLGTGGIWVRDLETGDTKLVHYEETNYRSEPVWSADGSAVVYVSDDAFGLNDIAAVPATGGNSLRLTWAPADELSPAPSPDGSTLALVSNHDGPTTLMTVSAAGGRPIPVPITGRKARVATGRVRATVHGPDGRLTAARVHLRAADGRFYAPDDGFARVVSATETRYFHAAGSFEVEVPAGTVALEVLKGFEHRPWSGDVEVPEDGVVEVEVRLDRIVDAPARGWISGDTHLHDWHAGRWGLTPEDLRTQLAGEDVHVANFLVHMDDTRVMGRWSDVTGVPHPVSTPDTVVMYGEEFRGSLGHVGMLGIQELILPVLGGVRTTAYQADAHSGAALSAARAQGGIGGFLHPFYGDIVEPGEAARSDIPMQVALGNGEFFDVVCIWSDEPGSAGMYYRFLNAGFRLAATGGSDTPSNVWRAPPPGTGRTYAQLDGPVSHERWIDAVRAGRTFATNGPLLFLDVEGRQPGDELSLGAGEERPVTVTARAMSLAPLDSVEIVANGRVVPATTVDAAGPGEAGHTEIEVRAQVELPDGGWIAARATGPGHRTVADTRPFAQTSPVWVVRQGRDFRSREEARFLHDAVEAMWRHVDGRDRWDTPEQRRAFLDAVERAMAVYRSVAERADAADLSHRGGAASRGPAGTVPPSPPRLRLQTTFEAEPTAVGRPHSEEEPR